MQETKFLLILSDSESIVDLQDDLIKIRQISLNFDLSPSIGVIYETYPECAKEYADSLRESGKKVGVYGTFQKALNYLNKSLNQ
jgi:hypothetical protein